jgi:hypothetical protein
MIFLIHFFINLLISGILLIQEDKVRTSIVKFQNSTTTYEKTKKTLCSLHSSTLIKMGTTSLSHDGIFCKE